VAILVWPITWTSPLRRRDFSWNSFPETQS